MRDKVKRMVGGVLLAGVLVVPIVVMNADPTEALCSVYTSSDPEWYLFACWRFAR